MRSRWYHRPVLHSEHNGEKKASWLELFYDLIFVAAIIQLGDGLSDLLHHAHEAHSHVDSHALLAALSDAAGHGGEIAHDATAHGSHDGRWPGVFAAFGVFALHFLALHFAWTGVTYFNNRFNIDDILHRVMVFANMFALGAMAVAAPASMGVGDGHSFHPEPALFSIGFAVATGFTVLMNLRAIRHSEAGRPWAQYWDIRLTVMAALFIAAAFVPWGWSWVLWCLAIILVMSAAGDPKSEEMERVYPYDFEHLSERFALLTIIVLGESFVKVLGYLGGGGYGHQMEYQLRGAFSLLLTCSIWWVYFDDVAGQHLKKGRWSQFIWVFSHMPLALSITGVGVAIKKTLSFDLATPAPDEYRWLLCLSLAIVFFSVGMIDSVTERKNAELSDRARINVRMGTALLLTLLGQAGASMTSRTFLIIVVAIVVANVIFDIMMAPFEEGEEEENAITIAQGDAERREGTRERKPPGTALGEFVRRGVPSEASKDFYYYFLEGSWTRLFVSFATVYLVANVFFAAIYMLEPGSISGGEESFGDAFFFSVQTMSTIGFGGMTPATGFADSVVTAEAFCGVFFSAVATGVVLAKLSRPGGSILFSEKAIVSERHGMKTLMLRAGNARGNDIVDATASVTVLVEDLSPEGHHVRRLLDLPLVRKTSPIFSMSWTLMHEIDEQSPLQSVDWTDPGAELLGVIVTLRGHDGTYGQTTYARKLYSADDILFGHRFVDVIHEMESGKLLIDFTKFHDTLPDREAVAGAEVSDDKDGES